MAYDKPTQYQQAMRDHDPAAAGSPPPLLPPSPLEGNYCTTFNDCADEVIIHHPFARWWISRTIDGGIAQCCAMQAKILRQMDSATNLLSCGG
jgi:hypothetical protein